MRDPMLSVMKTCDDHITYIHCWHSSIIATHTSIIDVCDGPLGLQEGLEYRCKAGPVNGKDFSGPLGAFSCITQSDSDNRTVAVMPFEFLNNLDLVGANFDQVS